MPRLVIVLELLSNQQDQGQEYLHTRDEKIY